MKPSHVAKLRLAAVLASLTIATSALATYPPNEICLAGGGTGLTLANDNGLRAPFGYNPCLPNPIVHIYKCEGDTAPNRDYNGNKTLFLGSGMCQCATPSTSCQDYCNESPVQPGSLIEVCGGVATPSPTCLWDDGLKVISTKAATGGYLVTFGICYKAVNSALPVLFLRFANPSITIDKNYTLKNLAACSPNKPALKPIIFLPYGDYDVQMTIHDKNCMDTNQSPYQTIYIGGETENYPLHVLPPPLLPNQKPVTIDYTTIAPVR